MAKIIDGKTISQQIKDEVKARVEQLTKTGRPPALAVVLVGDDPASHVYVGSKKKACEYTGIKSLIYEMPGDVSQEALNELIDSLNQSDEVDGILVQFPLPAHLSEEEVILRVSAEKDVDCFNPYNVGLLYSGTPRFLPCTPAGVIELLKRSGIEIAGKQCVVIGRSNLAGKPCAQLLLAENGTVTVCHSKTENLAKITSQADILVAAIGKKRFVGPDMIKEGAAVIDIGIHRLGGKKICGDVDYDACFEKAGAITPTPGGTGVMTVAVLMQNCLKAYEYRSENQKQ